MSRVLLIGRGPPERGGISAFMVGLQKALSGRHSVDLLNLTRGEHTAAGRLSGGNVLRTLADTRAVWRRARDYDVVHLHTAFVPAVTMLRAVLLAVAARLRGRPVILHVHSGKVQLWVQGRLRRTFARTCLRSATLVVAVSHGAYEALQSVAASGRLRLVENGVDTELFRPADRPETSVPTVLYVGLLTPRKGVLDLLEASATLRARGLAHELVIAGGTPDEGAEAEKEVRAAASGAAHLVGVRSHEQMPQVYGDADVFCLPSWWEAMPLTLLEAMGCGLPVVATAVGDIPRMVENGVSGTVVPPRDPGALGAALADLLGDPEAASAMGRAARRRVEEHYRSEFAWGAIEKLYEELKASPSTGR